MTFDRISLDFGAGIYDSRSGRFLSLDPLLSKYPYYSPYIYAGNKPIKDIDKKGQQEAEHDLAFIAAATTAKIWFDAVDGMASVLLTLGKICNYR